MAEVRIGDRFASLVVTAVRRGSKGVHPVADCLCDCGSICSHRVSRLRTGRATRCGPCARKETWRTRERPSSEDMAIRRRHEIYSDNAARRSHAFELTSQQTRELFLSDCHYCGHPPSTLAKAKGSQVGVLVNGIDRLDSSLGYTAGNVVPCCPQCNFAKRDMSVSDFLAWAARVALHQKAARA